MNVMRYTIVDGKGAVSFVAPCEVLKVLVAGCCANPPDLDDLLSAAERLDAGLPEYVYSGLAVFDEHNLDGNHNAIHRDLADRKPHNTPVFRVVDDITREASLRPVKAGLIIFNLLERRIVQVQNTYDEIRRAGSVRVRDTVKSTMRVHRYRLPADWAIVP